MAEDCSSALPPDPGITEKNEGLPSDSTALVVEKEDASIFNTPDNLPGEILTLISTFEESLSTTDSNLTSTLPQIQNILCQAAKGAFESLKLIMGHTNSWPAKEIEALLAKDSPDSPQKALNKASQQHLQDCWAKILPLFQAVLQKEASCIEKGWEDSTKLEELKEKTEGIMLELAQEKKATMAAQNEANAAKKKALEMEKNAHHMITDHRRLTEDLEEKTKQLQEQAQTFEKNKQATTELQSYQKKEEEFALALKAKDEELKLMKTKNKQLIEGNEIHLKKIQNLEGRNQELLDDTKELLQKNAKLEDGPWQMAGGKGEKTFARVVSPQASSGTERAPTLTPSSTSPPPVLSPTTRPPLTSPLPVHTAPERQKLSAPCPDQINSDGIFSTFYVTDFAAFISSNSIEFSKGYLKRICDLKNSIYADVKAAFCNHWAKIEPISAKLVPNITLEEKVFNFRAILRDICIARVPDELRLRLEHLRQGRSYSTTSTASNFFLLPGLIPGRNDFVHLYNETIQCANRANVQLLLAFHIPQLWRHIALLEHYSDNMAQRTKFVYAPRSGSSDFDVALNLVCLFLAEEVLSLERYNNGLGPCQTSDRPMVPDTNTFDSDQVNQICLLKNTPYCMRYILNATNPFAAFYTAYKEEKIKFRNMLHPKKMEKPGNSGKRKNTDDGHLFD